MDVNRPASRRGANGASGDGVSPVQPRPPPSRLGTATRLTTSMSNMGTAVPPKTSSRISTAVSRANQNILNRPITQQGISGLATSSGRGGMSRQIQDRRYWEGILQLKMRDLQQEVIRLQTVTESAAREQSARRHYDRKVREMATDLTELQGKLSDYNMVLEKSSSGVNRSEMDDEAKALREQNEELQGNVEQVFEHKQKAEEELQQLEKELEKENKSINVIINAMPENERETYLRLQEWSAELQTQANDLQVQLEMAAKERDQHQVQISGSQSRQDAVRLLQRLGEAEARRTQLQTEQANRLTPAQEREKLLLQVREDNAAVASLDGNSNTLKEEIAKKKLLLEQAEQDLEEGRSDRHQKYIELRRRDEAMEEYLQAFPTALQQETARVEALEATSVFCLEHCSLGHIGDVTEQSGKSEKQLDTEEGLAKEHATLTANIKKVQAMENKMREELSSLHEAEANLKRELALASDLQALKDKHAEHVMELQAEAKTLQGKRAPTKSAVKEAQRKYDELKKKLDGNEVYTHLKSLEDKLLSLDSTINELQNNVQSATKTASYDEVKSACLQALNRYNEMLNSAVTDHTYPTAS